MDEYTIMVNGRWVKVTWYIWRSWTGPKRLNGEACSGPAVTLGKGLPNPYVESRA